MSDDVEIVEMTGPEELWHEWAGTMASGIATPGCDCGHDGLGVSWHMRLCPGAVHATRAKVRELMELAWTGGLLRAPGDPIELTGDPTAANPWTVTLAWTPDQNHGAVSIMPRRVPVYAVLGLIRAGEPHDEIAADFDLTLEEVAVIERLAEEASEWA